MATSHTSWVDFVADLDKSDMSQVDLDAMKEMHNSLRYVYQVTDMMGLYLWKPTTKTKNLLEWLKENKRFLFVAFLVYHCIYAESIYMIVLIAHNPNPQAFIPIVHLYAFAALAGIKYGIVRGFRDRFKNLIIELGELWPRAPLSEEAIEAKSSSLFRLRWFHRFYIFVSATAVMGFNMFPILIRYIQLALGMEAKKEPPFYLWYPFDNFAFGIFEICYAFEVLSGSHVVMSTVGTNLLFSGMSSHVCLLLKMLQINLRDSSGPYTDEQGEPVDSGENIVQCIKTHQRLIKYVGDLENAFTVILLANVTVISINICCAGFTCMIVGIFVALPTILFIMSNLMEMGLLCWYGDNVMGESMAVGEAIYFSQWYNTKLSSRKLQLLIMARSQVPLKFTALNFKDITLESYSSIIVTSYSYFTLLCKMYEDM